LSAVKDVEEVVMNNCNVPSQHSPGEC